MTTTRTLPRLTTEWRRADTLRPGDRFLDSQRTEHTVVNVVTVAHPMDSGLDFVVIHTATSTHPFPTWKSVATYAMR